MSTPPRVIVAVVLAVLAVWAIFALPHARGLRITRMQRWLLPVGVATFLAALSAWVVFAAPAYWD